MEMKYYNYPSPCQRCVRVPDPDKCDNKECRPWRQWFLDRWELIHRYPRAQAEQAQLKPVGVIIGGTRYAAPHTVQAYLAKDPCGSCVCTADMCTAPCPERLAWESAKGGRL